MARFQEKTMIPRMALAVLATVTLLAGCATHWDVDSFEAPEGNVAAKRTFYWKGGEFSTPSSSPNPELVASATAAVRHAVTTELTRKEFTKIVSRPRKLPGNKFLPALPREICWVIFSYMVISSGMKTLVLQADDNSNIFDLLNTKHDVTKWYFSSALNSLAKILKEMRTVKISNDAFEILVEDKIEKPISPALQSKNIPDIVVSNHVEQSDFSALRELFGYAIVSDELIREALIISEGGKLP